MANIGQPERIYEIEPLFEPVPPQEDNPDFSMPEPEPEEVEVP